MAGGRPSKYDEKLHPRLAKAYAMAGLTDAQMAEELGIALATLKNWKNDFPEFMAALTEGKEGPDGRVEDSLFRRAIGYSLEVEKPMVVSDGAQVGSHVEVVKYREKVPPNVTAQIFWLKNRRPDRWRDKQDIQVETGPLEIKVTHETEGI